MKNAYYVLYISHMENVKKASSLQKKSACNREIKIETIYHNSFSVIKDENAILEIPKS